MEATNANKKSTVLLAVENVLKTSQKSRNSNNWLVLATLYQLGLIKKSGSLLTIDLNDMKEFPQFEAITRAARDLKHEDPTLKGNRESEIRKEEQRNIFKNKEKRMIEQSCMVVSKYDNE